MSKNYNKFYNNQVKEKSVEKVVENDCSPAEEIRDEEAMFAEDVKEETAKTVLYEAVVDGCEKLRVRSEDKPGDNIVTTIEKGDHLYILSDNKDSEFYGVQLEDGTLGFCMKKFVEIYEDDDFKED